MNASSQYWVILAAFVSLAFAATLAVRRSRSVSSILYACSAWLAMLFGAGLILEPFIANENFVAPDGAVAIHYNMTLHRIMSWGLTFSALLVVVASAAYVFEPDPVSSSPADCIQDQDGG